MYQSTARNNVMLRILNIRVLQVLLSVSELLHFSTNDKILAQLYWKEHNL